MSKTKKPARQPKASRVGIASRIYAALGVLTLLTIVASSVAWFSYERVSATVDDMVVRKMPVVELALELSQAATTSTALAPRFMEVQTVKERAALTGEFDKIEAKQFDLVRKIGQLGNVDNKKTQSALDNLSRQINDINDLTGERMRNASNPPRRSRTCRRRARTSRRRSAARPTRRSSAWCSASKAWAAGRARI